ncbi:PQQ-binding-like beta-propeller repeat protein [Haloplanus salinarum]|uniref:outer membrane protein assembly factor BamB family protein n=1 Tax=Haloplanus salinarum TaxID=1912324 RepID=UPI00214AB868|nr:PQQ-binding-like beta-propeller repeat protein [Haloplanus salinarum]
MGRHWTRRKAIRVAGSAAIGGGALLSGGTNGAAGQRAETWTQYGYDGANTGHAPDNTGFTENVGVDWRFQAERSVMSSPAVVNNVLYVATGPHQNPGNGHVYALDTGAGTEIWRFETEDEFGAFGLSSPTIVDDKIILNNEGRVHALSRDDGKALWSEWVSSNAHTSSTVVDGTVFVAGDSSDAGLYALSASDGTEQWFFGTQGRVSTTPAVANGTVYVAARERGSDEATVHAIDTANGTERWRFDGASDAIHSSPAVAGDTVYFGSHDTTVYALNTDDGSERWRFEAEQEIFSSPAVANGTVYVGAVSQLHALDAQDGSERWRFEMGTFRSSPVVVNGVVYFGGTNDYVYAVNANDGSQLWRFEALNSVSSSPAVVNGTVYIGSEDNNVYALTGDATSQVETESRIQTPTATQPATASSTGTDGDETDENGVGGDGRTSSRTPEGDGGNGDLIVPLTGVLAGAGGGIWYWRHNGENGAIWTHGPLGGTQSMGPPERVPQAPAVDVVYDELTDEEPIGAGGSADVVKVTLPTSEGDVPLAIKRPRTSNTLEVDEVETLLREAETWDKLDDHDHIVGVVDYGATPLPWIAMEYMDGGDLSERTGDLEFDQAVWTAEAIARGVRHAHRRGVAHLDLKPANVLFRSIEDAWDVPKVADWGLSKHLIERSETVEGLSPQYAAPEQFDDDFGVPDDVTDVYQLGTVLYELFTGKPPFEGQPAKAMHRVLNERPTPPSEISDVPPALDDILLPALAKEKKDRYESVLLLQKALQELRDD